MLQIGDKMPANGILVRVIDKVDTKNHTAQVLE